MIPSRWRKAGSETDLLWDISLRARIDEAMDAGEIYCVYQPKIDLLTGAIAGVEALIRWHDPARGFIADALHPAMRESRTDGAPDPLCIAERLFGRAATALPQFTMISMSVNISATLLGDMRVVGLVRNVAGDPFRSGISHSRDHRDCAHFRSYRGGDDPRRIALDRRSHCNGRLRRGAASYETFSSCPLTRSKSIACSFPISRDDPRRAQSCPASLRWVAKRESPSCRGRRNESSYSEILNEMGCDELQHSTSIHFWKKRDVNRSKVLLCVDLRFLVPCHFPMPIAIHALRFRISGGCARAVLIKHGLRTLQTDADG